MDDVNMTQQLVLVMSVAMTFEFTGRAALGDEGELPLGAAIVIIETTDNDIELPVFVEGMSVWKALEIFARMRCCDTVRSTLTTALVCTEFRDSSVQPSPSSIPYASDEHTGVE